MKPGLHVVAAAVGAIVLAVASCSSSPEQPSTTSAPTTEAAVFTPVIGEVLAPPIPVPATDSRVHLAYELKLTNTLSQDVTLTSVAAVAGDKTLLSLSGNALAYWTRALGKPAPTTTLGPGVSALVWLASGSRSTTFSSPMAASSPATRKGWRATVPYE